MSHNVLLMQNIDGSGLDDQVLYFAANTLHKKSRQDVTDLNVSDLDALRHSLMSLIVQSNKKNIQNRLCFGIRSSVRPPLAYNQMSIP